MALFKFSLKIALLRAMKPWTCWHVIEQQTRNFSIYLSLDLPRSSLPSKTPRRQKCEKRWPQKWKTLKTRAFIKKIKALTNFNKTRCWQTKQNNSNQMKDTPVKLLPKSKKVITSMSVGVWRAVLVLAEGSISDCFSRERRCLNSYYAYLTAFRPGKWVNLPASVTKPIKRRKVVSKTATRSIAT